ncbi:hypothetical protein ACO0LM_27790 [Undibacterium sp. Di26W]
MNQGKDSENPATIPAMRRQTNDRHLFDFRLDWPGRSLGDINGLKEKSDGINAFVGFF